MKIKSNIPLLIIIVILFFTASCSKEDLVDPPKVILNVDWSNRTEGVAIPKNYKVIINNKTITYQNVSNTLPDLVAGTYPVSVYSTAERITIEGTKATVATANNIVHSQPGWLFYSDLDIIYENDKEITATAIMQQQIHLLNIELDITEGDTDDIKSIEASLSGVANSVDLKTKTYTGTGLTVVPVFIHNNTKLSASVRLIGLTDEVQNLTLDITYKNGTKQQIISDISNELTGFNTDKHKPVTLKGNTKILTRVEYETVITDWETQDSIIGDAEEQ